MVQQDHKGNGTWAILLVITLLCFQILYDKKTASSEIENLKSKLNWEKQVCQIKAVKFRPVDVMCKQQFNKHQLVFLVSLAMRAIMACLCCCCCWRRRVCMFWFCYCCCCMTWLISCIWLCCSLALLAWFSRSAFFISNSLSLDVFFHFALLS